MKSAPSNPPRPHWMVCFPLALVLCACAGAGGPDTGGIEPDTPKEQGVPDGGTFDGVGNENLGGGRGDDCPGLGPHGVLGAVTVEGTPRVLVSGDELPFEAQVEAGAGALISVRLQGYAEEEIDIGAQILDGADVLGEGFFEAQIPNCDEVDAPWVYDLALPFTPPLNQFSLDGKAATLHLEALSAGGASAEHDVEVVLVAIEEDF